MVQGRESAEAALDPRLLRATPRFKLFQPSEMRVGTERFRVHLLDLSASGALVNHASPPPIGSVVQLDCAGALRLARVMRHEGTRFGVQFLAPLTDAQVAATVVG